MRHEQARPQLMYDEPSTRTRDDPFGILVLADLRGAGSGGPVSEGAGSGGPRSDGPASRGLSPDSPSLATRAAHAVDRDDLDQVIAHLSPSVTIAGTGPDEPALHVTARSMADFHPDQLLKRIRAEAPATGTDDTSGERREGGGGTSAASDDGSGGERPTATREDRSEGGGGLLDQILDADPDARPSGNPLDLDLDAFVRQAVERHTVPADDTGADEATAALDASRARQLRRLLQSDSFKALEARWRSIELLVHRLDTGPQLKVFVVQATADEIVAGAAGGQLATLLQQTASTHLGGTPWAVAVLDHAFGHRTADLTALEALTKSASDPDTAFVAEVDPSLLDLGARTDDSPERWAQWRRIRTAPGAARLGLLLPRFLVREPYAPGENPLETLEFRELPEGRTAEAEQLVWAHPGVLAALFLGLSFSQEGWSLQAGSVNRARGFLIGLHPGPDGVMALPAVELSLDRSTISSLVEAGFMPVAGPPGEGTLSVPSFRSVADPPRPLRGPW